ncbi:MAG: helix-turn-helix transcriptional regulator, partial [Synechococcaceae cyanobacterium RM1_1_27]|nr:helix-turn-helix transcriptional regulator [Synechococcaceae cyanobacterium RM1_1_27]
QHDQQLRARMAEVGIPSWAALQQRAGISRRAMDCIRHGRVDRLRWSQLGEVAVALEWPLPVLLRLLTLIADDDVEDVGAPALSSRDPQDRQDTQAEVFQTESFRTLQLLLTQYPSACKLAQTQPDLPAKNLVALFRPLETLMVDWGIQPIGQVWEAVDFDPVLHQPDQGSMMAGDPVFIRYVGYRRGEQILCPAKVSRTLPSGATPQEAKTDL